jgi:hypothetical protein
MGRGEDKSPLKGLDNQDVKQNPTPAVASAVASKRETTPPASGFAFMGVFREVWKASYGGEIPKGSAKNLKPLITEHGEEETLRRFRIYLDATEGSYANVSRFASTFGTWKEQKTTTREDPLFRYAEDRYSLYFDRGFTRNVSLETTRELIARLVTEGTIDDGDAFYEELLVVKPWVLLRDATKYDRTKHVAEIARLVRPKWKAAA